MSGDELARLTAFLDRQDEAWDLSAALDLDMLALARRLAVRSGDEDAAAWNALGRFYLTAPWRCAGRAGTTGATLAKP